MQCWQFKIDAHNAEKAEEFVRDITFAFIKNAANRQADDAGRLLSFFTNHRFYSSRGCRGRRWKERWQKEGWQVRLIIMLILKHNY